MLRLVHHAVSALRSCIQLKRWGFEPSLSSCFSYTLSVIVAMWMKTGSFLQLCASVSLYFAVKFSFPVCLILHHSTKGKQIPVALYAAPAGHHPPARRSVVPPPAPAAVASFSTSARGSLHPAYQKSFSLASFPSRTSPSSNSGRFFYI